MAGICLQTSGSRKSIEQTHRCERWNRLGRVHFSHDADNVYIRVGDGDQHIRTDDHLSVDQLLSNQLLRLLDVQACDMGAADQRQIHIAVAGNARRYLVVGHTVDTHADPIARMQNDWAARNTFRRSPLDQTLVVRIWTVGSRRCRSLELRIPSGCRPHHRYDQNQGNHAARQQARDTWAKPSSHRRPSQGEHQESSLRQKNGHLRLPVPLEGARPLE